MVINRMLKKPLSCHAREGGHPEDLTKPWIPAFAGMTNSSNWRPFQQRVKSNLRKPKPKATRVFFLAKSLRLSAVVCCTFLFACGSSEIKPVDIYPEDMCSHCRMAISDQRFASEIITASGEVFKFDDLGCMEQFREKFADRKPAAAFVKDYEQKIWIAYERSTIVRTSIATPMSSSKVAFADSARAQEFLRELTRSGK